MNKKYTDLKPNQVDYIVVKNTDSGPLFEDIFFLIFSNDLFWEIPNSEEKSFLNWLETFPDINMELFIKSMGCVENRIFIIYKGKDQPNLSQRKKAILEKRLSELLINNFEISDEKTKELTKKIMSQYGQEKREYHNLEHIQHSLWELDKLNDNKIDKTSIELAIWFHDYCYKAGASDNEVQSAKFMEDNLRSYTSQINIQFVKELILAHPKSKNLSLNQKIFLDIDYSIFGQKPLEYMSYKQNINLEYQCVPKWIFRFKRKAFLKRLLRSGVFQTEWFKEKYKEKALKNIKDELSHWTYKLLPTL